MQEFTASVPMDESLAENQKGYLVAELTKADVTCKQAKIEEADKMLSQSDDK